jgi:hypothetical protein
VRFCNPPNERIKRKYYDWLKEAKGRNEATVDQAAAARSTGSSPLSLAEFVASQQSPTRASSTSGTQSFASASL